MDAQKPQRAMISYEKALSWRELFELTQLQKVDHEDIVAMAYRMAGMCPFDASFFHVND